MILITIHIQTFWFSYYLVVSVSNLTEKLSVNESSRISRKWYKDDWISRCLDQGFRMAFAWLNHIWLHTSMHLKIRICGCLRWLSAAWKYDYLLKSPRARHFYIFRQLRHIDTGKNVFSWWRHQIETSSALLAFCAGNSLVKFPSKRLVTRSDVFVHLCLNRRLSKQWWGWWFETQSRPLWRHCCVFPLLLCSTWCGHLMFWKSFWVFVLHIAISHFRHYTDLSESIEHIKCLSGIFVGCLSKMKFIIPIIFHAIF